MNVLRIVVVLALLSAGATVLFDNAHAQGIDYGEIDKFQSLGTGTLQVGAPPKTIVDDGELVRSECSFTEGVAARACICSPSRCPKPISNMRSHADC